MVDNPKNKRLLYWISVTASGLILIESIVFIIGWFFQIPSLLKPMGSSWSMPLSSAICIFLTAFYLILSFFNYKWPLLFIGMTLLTIGGWRIGEIVLDINLAHDEIFYSMIPHLQIQKEPMGEFAAILFMLSGTVALLLFQKEESLKNLSVILISQIIIVIASLGLIAIFLPIKLKYIWTQSSPVHLYTTISMIIIGIIIYIKSISFSLIPEKNYYKKSPILLSIFLILLTIFLTRGMAKTRNEAVKTVIETTGIDNVTVLSQHFTQNIKSLNRMKKRIEFEKKEQSILWEEDTHSFLHDYPSFNEIYLLNNQYIVKEILPPEKSDIEVGNPYNFKPHELVDIKEAVKLNRIFYFLSEKDELTTINILLPLYWDDVFKGALVTKLSLKKFYENNSLENVLKNYSSLIEFKENQLFSINKDDAPIATSIWSYDYPLTLGTLKFNASITPKLSFLNQELNNTFLYLSLFGGIIFSLSAGALLSFWGIFKDQYLTLKTFHQTLDETQLKLINSINSAGIGTFSYDYQNQKLELDKTAAHLFGFSENNTKFTMENLIDNALFIDRPFLKHTLEELLNHPRSDRFNFASRFINTNNKINWISVKGQILTSEDTNTKKLFGSAWDITEQNATLQRLQVTQETFKVFNEASSLKKAAQEILEELNREFGTEVITTWLIDPKTNSLKCENVTLDPSVDDDSFKETNKNLLGIDQTIPNYVIRTLHPLITSNISDYIPIYKFKEPSKNNLQGVVAFPIFMERTLIGVVELFKRSNYVFESDVGTENLLSTIGISLGLFIQKLNARKHEEQLLSIISHSADALFLLDKEGIIISWNQGGERIFGYKPQEIIGKNVTTLLSPAQNKEIENLKNRFSQENEFAHVYLEGIRKNGTLIWAETSVVPIRDDKGVILYGSVLVEDKTKQREDELLLKRNEEKLKALVETSSAWIWEMNLSRALTYSSNSVIKILGYTVEEVLGKDLIMFFFDEDKAAYEEEFSHRIIEPKGWRNKLRRLKHKDGTERFVESSGEPIFCEKSILVGFRGASQNITEKLLIDKRKEDFLSVVSHELRTPLTSIHGSLGLLLSKEALTDRVKELLTIAYRNSERLIKLINDLLDLQKVQFKKLTLTLSPTKPLKAIQESIASFESLIKNSGKKIVITESLPEVYIKGEHERLVQVMDNLISNAIKFSPENSTIEISMKVIDNNLRIAVKDPGKGIPKEFQPHIFEKFARAESGDARKTPGTGLGLNICKNMIEQMGGKISFTTKENEGTTFYVDLPITEER